MNRTKATLGGVLNSINRFVHNTSKYTERLNFYKNIHNNIDWNRPYSNRVGVYWYNYGNIINALSQKIGSTQFLNNGLYSVTDEGSNLGQREKIVLDDWKETPYFEQDAIRNTFNNYIDYINSFEKELYSNFINGEICKPFPQVGVKQVFAIDEIDTQDTRVSTIGQDILSQILFNKNQYQNERRGNGDFLSISKIDFLHSNGQEIYKNAQDTIGEKDYRGKSINVSEDNLLGLKTEGIAPTWGSYKPLEADHLFASQNSNLLPPNAFINTFFNKETVWHYPTAKSIQNGNFDNNTKWLQDIVVNGNNNLSLWNYISNFGMRGNFDTLYGKNVRYNFYRDFDGYNFGIDNSYEYVYGESNKGEGEFSHNFNTTGFIGDSSVAPHLQVKSFNGRVTEESLLKKTDKAFRLGEYDTLVSRYYNAKEENKVESPTQTAISSEFGISHGRNLLKTKKTTDHTYDNPYCRTWTNHNRYISLQDLIRGSQEQFRDVGKIFAQEDYQYYRTKEEQTNSRLSTYGIRNKNNGLINITPKRDKDGKMINQVKNCMFSLENLAWKGSQKHLSFEQKGPLGGRIMWFPPYNLQFSETVSVPWNETEFIGRGEKIYTYKNTERGGQLSFTLLIDHPSIINNASFNKTEDTFGRENSTPPNGANKDGVDDINSVEQGLLRFFAGCTMIKPPKKEQPSKSNPPKPQPKPQPKGEEGEFSFIVYFPNNYTGIDDGAENAMTYLLSGRGTKLFDPNGETRSPWGYETRKGSGQGLSNFNGIEEDEKKALVGYSKNKVNTKWYYRLDNRLRGVNKKGEIIKTGKNNTISEAENLWKDVNYKDTTNHGLNALGYQDSFLYKELSKNHNNIFSLMDIVVAIVNGEKSDYAKDLFNNENVFKIKEILEKYPITSVNIKGYANSHGHKESNRKLSKNRAETIFNWLRKKSNKFTNTTFNELDFGEIKINGQDVNSVEAKSYRASHVIIKYSMENVQAQYEEHSTNTRSVDNSIIQFSPQEIAEFEKSIQDARLELNNQGGDPRFTDVNIKEKRMNKGGNIRENIGRYDNEYTFFQQLEEKDPFLHHKVKDKIKYFDPAYHSMTPEGFHSRLTFLHQCTRQGNTIGASDSSLNNTANNLAFGRPPVCVLRIGDFYYTKIIIQSLDIHYENNGGISWDLNPEGIGVMPMWADVSITFKFIGGSDLTGPVTRLQNAMSFNYYANTSVYDDRADTITYDENGEINNFKAFIGD